MSFTPENIKRVFEEEIKEKEQNIMMGYLQEYINNLCDDCVSDRMTNVLSPKCRRRFLINVRILSGAKLEELPVFCYSQVVSNLERYLKKKTTLYTPVDTYIYNDDFLNLFFPKISKKVMKRILDGKLKDANTLITKSRVPAIPSKSRKERPGILRNILKKDKMIKEGSFIYDFNRDYFVVWANNTLYIADFKKGYALCNAHRKNIDTFQILTMILPLYAEGKEFKLKLEQNVDKTLNIKIVISGEKLINIDDELRNQKFSEITEKISPKFPRATFNFSINADLEIIVEVDDNCTYDDINFLFNTIGTLSEVENINLLEDI